MATVSQRPPGARQHTSVHWQRFSVPYAYPVHFTERLFDPANPVLVDTLSLRRGAPESHARRPGRSRAPPRVAGRHNARRLRAPGLPRTSRGTRSSAARPSADLPRRSRAELVVARRCRDRRPGITSRGLLERRGNRGRLDEARAPLPLVRAHATRLRCRRPALRPLPFQAATRLAHHGALRHRAHPRAPRTRDRSPTGPPRSSTAPARARVLDLEGRGPLRPRGWTPPSRLPVARRVPRARARQPSAVTKTLV